MAFKNQPRKVLTPKKFQISFLELRKQLIFWISLMMTIYHFVQCGLRYPGTQCACIFTSLKMAKKEHNDRCLLDRFRQLKKICLQSNCECHAQPLLKQGSFNSTRCSFTVGNLAALHQITLHSKLTRSNHLQKLYGTCHFFQECKFDHCLVQSYLLQYFFFLLFILALRLMLTIVLEIMLA